MFNSEGRINFMRAYKAYQGNTLRLFSGNKSATNRGYDDGIFSTVRSHALAGNLSTTQLTNQATNHTTNHANLQSVPNTVGKNQDIIMSHSE